MVLLFLTNNDNTLHLAEWLKAQGETVIVTGDKLTPDLVAETGAEFVISYNYRHIIRKEVLDLLPGRIINLHASLLPWNRGADPNVWSFLKETPKGVTVHLMDEGLDTGDVLLQCPVMFDKDETLRSSYKKLHDCMTDLLKEHWQALKSGAVVPRKQASGGSLQYAREFAELREQIAPLGYDTPVKMAVSLYRRLLAEEGK